MTKRATLSLLIGISIGENIKIRQLAYKNSRLLYYVITYYKIIIYKNVFNILSLYINSVRDIWKKIASCKNTISVFI